MVEAILIYMLQGDSYLVDALIKICLHRFVLASGNILLSGGFLNCYILCHGSTWCIFWESESGELLGDTSSQLVCCVQFLFVQVRPNGHQ